MPSSLACSLRGARPAVSRRGLVWISFVLVIAAPAIAQDSTPQGDTTPPAAPIVATPIATTAPSSSSHARFRFDAKVASGLLGFVGLVPQLDAGVTFGRWSIALGVGFLRGSLGASTVGTPGSSSEVSATLLSIAPTVLFDLVRSTDDRVALYALASLAPALLVLDTGSAGNCGSNGGFVLGYQAALGARYALHPQFMLGLEAGPTGQLSTPTGCATNGSTDVSVGLHGMYGAVVGTFIGL